jgi:Cu/Ag efflux pump CusA
MQQFRNVARNGSVTASLMRVANVFRVHIDVRRETLYSDQIQRAWPRSWRHGGRGAAAHRQGREAMFRAAEQRMRPMLMTALSACIGLLPPAVSTGIGSQVQRPLVWPAPQRAG